MRSERPCARLWRKRPCACVWCERSRARVRNFGQIVRRIRFSQDCGRRIFEKGRGHETVLCDSVAHHRRVRPTVQALLYFFGRASAPGDNAARRAEKHLRANQNILLKNRADAVYLSDRRRSDSASAFLGAARIVQGGRYALLHYGKSVPFDGRSVRSHERLRLREISAFLGRLGADARRIPKTGFFSNHARRDANDKAFGNMVRRDEHRLKGEHARNPRAD